MLMMAITNLNRGIIFDASDIKLTNRAGVGVGMFIKQKLRKNEEVVSVRELTDEELELIESKMED